jgi:hypothetical protein
MADRSGRPAPTSSRPGFQTVPRPLASCCRWRGDGAEDRYHDGGDDRPEPNLCKFVTPDHGFELCSQLDRAGARSSPVYPARRGRRARAVKEYSIFQSTPGCLSPLHVLVGRGFTLDFRRANAQSTPLRAALRIPLRRHYGIQRNGLVHSSMQSRRPALG